MEVRWTRVTIRRAAQVYVGFQVRDAASRARSRSDTRPREMETSRIEEVRAPRDPRTARHRRAGPARPHGHLHAREDPDVRSRRLEASRRRHAIVMHRLRE